MGNSNDSSIPQFYDVNNTSLIESLLNHDDLISPNEHISIAIIKDDKEYSNVSTEDSYSSNSLTDGKQNIQSSSEISDAEYEFGSSFSHSKENKLTESNQSMNDNVCFDEIDEGLFRCCKCNQIRCNNKIPCDVCNVRWCHASLIRCANCHLPIQYQSTFCPSCVIVTYCDTKCMSSHSKHRQKCSDYSVASFLSMNENIYKKKIRHLTKKIYRYIEDNELFNAYYCGLDLGILHYMNNEASDSVKYSIFALEQAYSLHNDLIIAAALNNIANLYLIYHSQVYKAEAHYSRALAIFRNHRDPILQGLVLSNIGYLYEMRLEYSKSLSYHLNSFETVNQVSVDNKSLLYYYYNNIALLLFTQERYEDSIIYFFKLLSLSVFLNDRRGEISSYWYLGICYGRIKNKELLEELYFKLAKEKSILYSIPIIKKNVIDE